jgi:hypothetical protein
MGRVLRLRSGLGDIVWFRDSDGVHDRTGSGGITIGHRGKSSHT